MGEYETAAAFGLAVTGEEKPTQCIGEFVIASVSEAISALRLPRRFAPRNGWKDYYLERGNGFTYN